MLRADVSLGPDNRSRGYGTVLLATAEDAGRAIDMFNGHSWQTRILEVRPDRLPQDLDHMQDISIGLHSPARTDLDYNPYGADNIRNIFVGNVSHTQVLTSVSDTKPASLSLSVARSQRFV